MKIRVLVVVGWLISLTCACFAQDVIVTKDARQINAKVTEVNVNDIKYKNFDNMDGPTYTLLKSDIASIVYQNGQVETFETENSTIQTVISNPVQTQTQSTTQPVLYSNKDLISRMQREAPILYQQYKSGQKQSATGSILLISGGVMTLVGLCAIIADDNDEDPWVSQTGTVLGVAGGLCLTAGIPIMIIGGTRKNNSLNTYRRQYTSIQSTPHFQLNLYGKGLGLTYVF